MILPPGGKMSAAEPKIWLGMLLWARGNRIERGKNSWKDDLSPDQTHPRSVQVAGLDEDHFFVAFAVCFVDLQELQSVIERPCFRTLAF